MITPNTAPAIIQFFDGLVRTGTAYSVGPLFFFFFFLPDFFPPITGAPGVTNGGEILPPFELSTESMPGLPAEGPNGSANALPLK